MDELFQHKGKYLSIHQLFEHALNNMDMFPPEAQVIISENMAKTKWIDERMDKNPSIAQAWILKVAYGINQHNIPVDVLSFSAIVYKGRIRGYDVKPLVDAMNANGKWLMCEQAKPDDYLTPLN